MQKLVQMQLTPAGGEKTVWSIKADLAFPCATQNELDETDAETLVANGVLAVSEGANMPSTLGAIDVFLKSWCIIWSCQSC